MSTQHNSLRQDGDMERPATPPGQPTGPQGPVATSHRDDPTHLVAYLVRSERGVSKSRAYTGGPIPTGWEIDVVDDRVPAQPSTCRNHSVANAPAAVWKSTGMFTLDCPCDTACPKCEAPVGKNCQTATGWPSKWHQERVKASPLCQALISGERTRCDLGAHPWRARNDVKYAKCLACGREEPIEPKPLPYNERWSTRR